VIDFNAIKQKEEKKRKEKVRSFQKASTSINFIRTSVG
jgi:hypothetical protein